MIEQNFGIKELYQVVLRAITPIQIGSRKFEKGEPVLYFENIKIASLHEQSKLTAARGGWLNTPRVTWEEKSEVEFQMVEGVMSHLSFGLMMDAIITTPEKDIPLLVPMKEGPFELIPRTVDGQLIYGIEIQHNPIVYPEKKVFIFEYTRGREQKKVYGELLHLDDGFGEIDNFIAIHDDDGKRLTQDNGKEYVVDYYYEYGNEALIYTLAKERFNGLFSLEGKFYAKDENEGTNYTNLLYMPKVRIVSNINLRLGERADPAVSTFNIVGLPEFTGRNSIIVEITRLGTDVDGNV